jgi:hypothetical protein
MKKFFVLALALALTAGAAYANYCARDYVPAATLLVPYAVVDMNAGLTAPDDAGYTTLLSVTNVSSDAQIIHVTVWSAQSTPVIDFDEVLSGYDVWTINFRDLMTGDFTQFDTNFNGFFGSPGKTLRGPSVQPFGPTTNAGFLDELTGPEDTDSLYCANPPYGNHPEYGQGVVGTLAYDQYAIPVQYCPAASPPVFSSPALSWLMTFDENPLIFYVTVDVVKTCNKLFPNAEDYYSDTIQSFDNVLIGEIVYVNTTLNYSEMMPAVHIENYEEGEYYDNNFYSLQFENAYDVDGREPLATAFAFRYYNSGGVSSQLLLWKNTLEVDYDKSLGDFAWACEPYVYYAWDQNELSKGRTSGPSGFEKPEPNMFPFETQSVPLDVNNFTGLMSGSGWMLLIFDPSLDVEGAPVEAWAGLRHLYAGFSAGLEAATMANYWCFDNQYLDLAHGHYLGVNDPGLFF